MEKNEGMDIFEQMMESLVIGQKISDLVVQLHTPDQVKCTLAACIDVFTKNHGGDSIAIVEDMLEMMREVRDEKEADADKVEDDDL